LPASDCGLSISINNQRPPISGKYAFFQGRSEIRRVLDFSGYLIVGNRRRLIEII
jgi:hypothetical protein